MSWNREIDQLEARKAELLAASEANRQVLVENWAKLEPVASLVASGITLARRIKTLWCFAAPLLALWAGRRRR